MSKMVQKLPEHSHAIARKRQDEAEPVSDRAEPVDPRVILQRFAVAPHSLRPADILRLQQTHGNRFVQRLLSQSSPAPSLVQAKLTVNAPGDKYEQEADRMAEMVTRTPAVQRGELEEEDETPEVMTKREQAHAAGGAFEAGEAFEHQLHAVRGQGQPLPHALKEEFETKFGADFGGVKVHTDAQADELNRLIHAKAFTHGQDIYVGAGQYNPASPEGRRLLAHELTHVVQQKSGNSGQTIQRLIGFEIETRIPLWFREKNNTLSHPDYDTINANVGLGDASKLTVDKEGETSIIEFVSAPVDDMQDSKDFRRTAERWVGILKKLRDSAEKSPPIRNLHSLYRGAPKNTRFGFRKRDLATKEGELDKVAIQATHGLRLDLVAQYMSEMTYKDKTAGRSVKKEQALHETSGITNNLMDAVEARFDPRAYATMGEGQREINEFHGFLSLMVHYLLLGAKSIVAYLKNQLSLFYKSKLSDVRNNLALGANQNGYAAHVLGSEQYRVWLFMKLLQFTERNSEEKLFRSSKGNVTVGDWLEDVLSGKGDPFFEAAKNPWSNAIAPGKVNDLPAVVVEHRDLPLEHPSEDELKISKPTGIVEYLVSIFDVNQAAQELGRTGPQKTAEAEGEDL